ncbi:O-antigen ligase family protein [Devosia oryziradicis]|uniref:O-antigen ligase family protein n=1 Tax=Devosia oryziradicis TaxID=2801335 RepID=A0ABX7BUX6_9HYPH|nr:O-antigen ligase family protein [Devosia oryziradicis]QQR35353.1 O-antigen ligase family protein [Devosia oryziradicis]
MVAVAATILPPGYPAYIGTYIALVAAILGLVAYGWSERETFAHPTSLAIVGAIALVGLAVPFVYRGPQDIVGPVLILPMLATVALGLLARPARWVPNPETFALICLAGALIALLGGGYEDVVLGRYRPGLGNNPIHYASLAAMSGCLAMVGVVASHRRSRYFFLLGPIFGLGCAVIADSRGPMLGVVAMSGVGLVLLTTWLWREKPFRIAILLSVAGAAVVTFYLVGTGNARIAGIVTSGLDIFRFTGGPDDIRAALYASALEILKTSPLFGIGLGQIMVPAQTLYPSLLAGTGLENLHADWANFAAMAGILGLLAWFLLLGAPLFLLLDARARQDRPIVLGALLLTTGQLALGVSNATFGILPQTVIYAVALGYFLVRARRLGD